ncbi:hypothetical protein ACR31S_00285 [Streptococcus iniae]
MKHKKLIGAGAAIALVFSACGYELGRYQAEKANANSIAYIDASKPSKVHKNNYHQKKIQMILVEKKGFLLNKSLLKFQTKVM